MPFPPIIPKRIKHSEDIIIQSLLKIGMEGAQRLPFSRRPYTTMMDDTAIIIGDMVADADMKWKAGIMSRFKAGQLPSAGPLAPQSPLITPERLSGKLLNTAS